MKQAFSGPNHISFHEITLLPSGAEIAQLLNNAARPFVIASDRELSVLRRGLTKEGWKRSLFIQDAPADTVSLRGSGLLARANQLLAADTRIPEPESAGLCHSREGGNPEHNSLANGCLALGIVYQIDRDPEFAEKAAEILRGYADAYAESTTGWLLEHPEDEAAWIIPLVQAYDLVFHSKSLINGDKAAIEDKLFKPVAERMVSADGTNSCAAWQMAALGVIGCATKDASMVDTALDRFAALLHEGLSENGLWVDQKGGNHFHALTAFIHLAEACSRIGIDLYNLRLGPGKSLKSMFLAPINCFYPSLELPSVLERECGQIVPLSLYEVAYRRWADLAFAWVLKTGYSFAQHPVNDTQIEHRTMYTRSSLYAFLFGRDLPGRVQKPKLESSVFPELGMCTLRSGNNTMVSLGCSKMPQSAGLNLSLYAADRLLIPDNGVSQPSNTVLVDGECASGTECDLRLFQPGDYLQIAEARAAGAETGHTRRVVLAGDLVLVEDSLSSDSVHSYNWLLNFKGKLLEPEAAEGDDFTIRWETGDAGLAVRAITDRDASLTSEPTVDLHTEGRCAQFAALLAPYKGETSQIERLGQVFKVTCGNVTEWVRYCSCHSRVGGNPGDQPSMDSTSQTAETELETDAEFAAIREVDGSVTACGLYRGSFIKLRGEPILTGPRQFERVEVRLDARNPVIYFEGASGDHLMLKCNSRAMRVNGHRISAANFDGMATIRLVGVLAEAVTS